MKTSIMAMVNAGAIDCNPSGMTLSSVMILPTKP